VSYNAGSTFTVFHGFDVLLCVAAAHMQAAAAATQQQQQQFEAASAAHRSLGAGDEIAEYMKIAASTVQSSISRVSIAA
jgi:hypothetical protein